MVNIFAAVPRIRPSVLNSTAGAATALFVMGLEEAMAFCKQHQIEAVFVCKDHTVHVTDGLKPSFELQSTEYTYAE